MEEIDLTSGQFQRLLNSTAQPKEYTDEVASLVAALHAAQHTGGHKWRVTLSEADIAEALTLFEENNRVYRTPGAQQSWNYFVRSSATARRLHDERHGPADVPRETLEGDDE